MAMPSRMPHYDIRNDGTGPYAIFYCETCSREFRAQPDVKNTIASDIGRKAASDLLRKVPLFGGALAENVVGEDPRYVMNLTPQQLQAQWDQVKARFRECPTCQKVMCISDFDEQSGFCNEDSPRVNEITEARGEQVGAGLKGLANAFGLGGTFGELGNVVKQGMQAAQQAGTSMARCPNDGTLAAAGTKFCPECGTPVAAPAPAGVCPKCGAQAQGAKFCPECGTKIG